MDLVARVMPVAALLMTTVELRRLTKINMDSNLGLFARKGRMQLILGWTFLLLELGHGRQ